MIEKVIKTLAEHPEEGLSYYEMYKHLTNHEGMDITKTAPRHTLENLREMKLVEKEGPKYRLKGPAVAYDGAILFANPPMLINCPHREKCNYECMNRECRFYEESPEQFQEVLDAVIEKS